MAKWENTARQQVDEENSIKATDMKIGQVIEGTVTAIDNHKDYENSYFIYLDNAGELTRIFTAGKLSYKVKDGLIVVGNTYRITRLEDLPAKKKGSKPMTNFEVLVDAETAKKALPAI